MLAIGVFLFVVNIVVSHRNHGSAPLDPWDARSLEWLTTNPPKEHNFDVIPTVNHLGEFFHRKYEDRGVDGHPDFHKVATAEEIIAQQEADADADAHIHLPSPSYWPIVTAFSLPIIAYGVIFNLVLVEVGAMILLIGVFGWGLEPHTAPDHDYDPPNDSVELDTISRG